MKYAIFSMDIEDWYHLDYFEGKPIDPSQTMLDGLNVYHDILTHYQIPSSYFLLGELIIPLASTLRQLAEEGADIGVHGWSHLRPLLMEPIELKKDLNKTKKLLEDVIQKPVLGYRAPCCSLDRDRLDVVRDVGFAYDSSRILFKEHPLYGTLDMDGFSERIASVFRSGDFFEFQLSTLHLAGFNVPVSGGGYIRIFPWFLMSRLLKNYLRYNEIYLLYIHPFELSRKEPPALPEGISISTKARFMLGLGGVEEKLHKLVQLLKAEKYEFITLADLRCRLLTEY
jgi:peptidoglycan/xylan/chitin deacetylase (PgdA/CDA1 family)